MDTSMHDIEALIKKMSLAEKAMLCIGATAWTTTQIDRLGIMRITVADGPHGVRFVARKENSNSISEPATSFPTASCIASTWDLDLIRELGQALGKECISMGVDILLGPGVNMKRTPLCGRNFEYYSEDPFLAGKVAASFIAGVQSQGVGTSLKHFAANNQESQRMRISSEMDERTLREIYLPAFEIAVKESNPWTVMCAYNKINGLYCSENARLLVNILKEEWGFEGMVISDWGAVHERVRSLKSGLDLEMPGPRDERVQAVISAVENGEINESTLDESIRRILGVVSKATSISKGEAFDPSTHHDLAGKIAAEGMVLLKNNDVLPLQDPKKIAVIGSCAKNARIQGRGSSHVNPTRLDNPYLELERIAGQAKITYAEGYPADSSFNPTLIEEAVHIAKDADMALLYIALPENFESEGYDRPQLDLTPHQVNLIKSISAVQAKTIVILNTGAPVAMGEWIGSTAGVLQAWFMGQAGGKAIADILFGKVNPSGKLAETFPFNMPSTPAFLNFPGENGQVRYGEGIFIGYRYYEKKAIPVQFPFGHGLSYTTFEYSNLSVSSLDFKDVDGIQVCVDVTNTGRMAGREVVQLYVHDHDSGLTRPDKELKAFSKIELQPGETGTVEMHLDFRSFAFFHPSYDQWITEDGDFDILIGTSSADIRCSQRVTLHSSLKLPSLLERESTLRSWSADPRGKVVLEPIFRSIMEKLEASLDIGSDLDSGLDPIGFLMDMSLVDLFYFQGGPFQKSPEEMVDELLHQVHE
jgi:beta-glucosidase